MEQCWNGDPALRPLLGNVEAKLIDIREHYRISQPPAGYNKNYMRSKVTKTKSKIKS